MRAALASSNAHKARELAALMPGWSIEPLDMRDAPEETGTHSSGTDSFSARSKAATRRSHSGAESAPMPIVGSDSTSTRSMPSGTFSVGVRIRPKTTAALFWP